MRSKGKLEKSKVMSVVRKREECCVMVGDKRLEQVDTMKYIGVMISSDGSMGREVEARIWDGHLELLVE